MTKSMLSSSSKLLGVLFLLLPVLCPLSALRSGKGFGPTGDYWPSTWRKNVEQSDKADLSGDVSKVNVYERVFYRSKIKEEMSGSKHGNYTVEKHPMRTIFIFSTTGVDVRFMVVANSGGAGGIIRTCSLKSQLMYDGTCGLVYDRDGGKLEGQPDYLVFKSPKDVQAKDIKPVRIMYAWIRSQEAPYWGCRFTGTEADTYSKDKPVVTLKPEICSAMDNDIKYVVSIHAGESGTTEPVLIKLDFAHGQPIALLPFGIKKNEAIENVHAWGPVPGSNELKGTEAMELLGTKLWVRLGASPEKRTADNLTINQVSVTFDTKKYLSTGWLRNVPIYRDKWTPLWYNKFGSFYDTKIAYSGAKMPQKFHLKLPTGSEKQANWTQRGDCCDYNNTGGIIHYTWSGDRVEPPPHIELSSMTEFTDVSIGYVEITASVENGYSTDKDVRWKCYYLCWKDCEIKQHPKTLKMFPRWCDDLSGDVYVYEITIGANDARDPVVLKMTADSDSKMHGEIYVVSPALNQDSTNYVKSSVYGGKEKFKSFHAGIIASKPSGRTRDDSAIKVEVSKVIFQDGSMNEDITPDWASESCISFKTYTKPCAIPADKLTTIAHTRLYRDGKRENWPKFAIKYSMAPDPFSPKSHDQSQGASDMNKAAQKDGEGGMPTSTVALIAVALVCLTVLIVAGIMYAYSRLKANQANQAPKGPPTHEDQ